MSSGGWGINSAVASMSAPISRFQSAPVISFQALICFAAAMYWRRSSNTCASIPPPRILERELAAHVLEHVAREDLLLGLGRDVRKRFDVRGGVEVSIVVRIVRAEEEPLFAELFNDPRQTLAVLLQQQIVNHEIKAVEIFIDGAGQHVLQISDLVDVLRDAVLQVDGELRASLQKGEVELGERAEHPAEDEVDDIRAVFERLREDAAPRGAVGAENRHALLADKRTGEAPDMHNDTAHAEVARAIVKIPPMRIREVDAVPIGRHHEGMHAEILAAADRKSNRLNS